MININLNKLKLYKRNVFMKSLALILLILLVNSCGIPDITKKVAKNDLPTSYNNSKDTLNSSQLSYKEFFNDENLTRLIDSALVNNQELNILLQKIGIANNEVLLRGGEYMPFVKLGAGIDAEKVGDYTRNGAVEENLNIKEDTKFPKPLANYQFGLYSTWELDVWSKLRNAEKVAVMEYLATIEGKNYLITSLVSEIASSYYELIAHDNQLMTLEQNIKIQQDVLDIIKQLLQSARSTSLAVNRFDAEVQKNKSELYSVKQEIFELENKINFLVGRMPQPVERTSTGFLDKLPNSINIGIPNQILSNRPDIKKAELELMAADLNIDMVRANFYPSFGLKAGVGYQAFNTKFLISTPESMLYMLGGDAIMPLVNRNAIEAEYKSASNKQIKTVYEYEQTVLNAYLEVVNEVSRINNLQSSYELKNYQVRLLNESIDIANQMFQSARADYMEVLLTQRDALEAKISLIELKKNQFLSTVNLYRKLGGGWR